MPKYFEFVFASYALWGVTFGVYMVLLMRRLMKARRSLARLEGSAPTE